MRPSTRFLLTVLAATAIALAIVAVPILLRGDDDAQPPPKRTPAPGIRATATSFTTAPEVPAANKRAARLGIEKSLVAMYRRAFAQPASTPAPDASPRPLPAARAATSMTKSARTALVRSPGVFDEAADLSVYRGLIRYGGVVTFEGKRPIEAFLDVDFAGEAVPIGSRSPRVRVRQLGTVVMKRFDHGWFVEGFDLRLVTRPVPTPTPSPR